MISDPAMVRALNERERVLANFYTRERHAGATPLEANERMLEFSKRLDELEKGK